MDAMTKFPFPWGDCVGRGAGVRAQLVDAATQNVTTSQCPSPRDFSHFPTVTGFRAVTVANHQEMPMALGFVTL
jgi:hypothetical protein